MHRCFGLLVSRYYSNKSFFENSKHYINISQSKTFGNLELDYDHSKFACAYKMDA